MPDLTPDLQSIRHALIGAVTDLVQDAGFGLTEVNIVVDLVYLLSEYREEEVPFFPDVYLVDGSEDHNVLAAIAPGMKRVSIGTSNTHVDAAAQTLKDCAALATDGWAVFIRSSGDNVDYGVFRSHELPVAVSAEESLADPETNVGAAMLIRNCSARCVELVSGSGKRMELSLTSSSPEKPVSTQISLLATRTVRDVPEPARSLLQAYLGRTITEICRRTHGTLIAVVPSDLDEVPETFCDGIILEAPIDFGEAFQRLHDSDDSQSAASLLGLQSQEALLRGMMSSDGITLFSTDGTVRGFRVFVKPDNDEAQQLEQVNIRGGARTRALELLKLRIGAPLDCVFFRSQDGRTECVVKDD